MYYIWIEMDCKLLGCGQKWVVFYYMQGKVYNNN